MRDLIREEMFDFLVKEHSNYDELEKANNIYKKLTEPVYIELKKFYDDFIKVKKRNNPSYQETENEKSYILRMIFEEIFYQRFSEENNG